MHTQLCWQSNPTAGQDRNTVTLSPLVQMLICIPRSVFGLVSTVIASLAATFCWLHDGQQLRTIDYSFIVSCQTPFQTVYTYVYKCKRFPHITHTQFTTGSVGGRRQYVANFSLFLHLSSSSHIHILNRIVSLTATVPTVSAHA